ncbi:hypothetical protein GCM10010400_67900 [Streptomyces aculeolatus]
MIEAGPPLQDAAGLGLEPGPDIGTEHGPALLTAGDLFEGKLAGRMDPGGDLLAAGGGEGEAVAGG